MVNDVDSKVNRERHHHAWYLLSLHQLSMSKNKISNTSSRTASDSISRNLIFGRTDLFKMGLKQVDK
jgi:hypothetical protein